MVKYYCDICKETYSKDDLLQDINIVTGEKTNVVGSGIFSVVTKEWTKAKIDICKDCYKKLTNQLNKVEAEFYQNRKV